MPESPQSNSPAIARRSDIVVPEQLNWRKKLLAWIGYVVIRSVAGTLRYRWQVHPAAFKRKTGPAIFCVWHNRLALSLIIYRQFARMTGRADRMAALVSASKDGAIVARLLEHFEVQPVRGSTSRRGPQALLEMTSWAERGCDLAVTPDGPRGPRYIVQEGVIYLAQLTGMPILPASYQLPWKICPKTWDRFQIPLPFGRAMVKVGEPVIVPREISDADREKLRQRLEATLKGLAED